MLKYSFPFHRFSILYSKDSAESTSLFLKWAKKCNNTMGVARHATYTRILHFCIIFLNRKKCNLLFYIIKDNKWILIIFYYINSRNILKKNVYLFSLLTVCFNFKQELTTFIKSRNNSQHFILSSILYQYCTRIPLRLEPLKNTHFKIKF